MLRIMIKRIKNESVCTPDSWSSDDCSLLVLGVLDSEDSKLHWAQCVSGLAGSSYKSSSNKSRFLLHNTRSQ